MTTRRILSSLIHLGAFCRWKLAQLGAQPFVPLRSYKVRASLRLRCSSCRFVKRKGRLRVVCDRKPRHKQKQGWLMHDPQTTSSMIGWRAVRFTGILAQSGSRLDRTSIYTDVCTHSRKPCIFWTLPVDKKLYIRAFFGIESVHTWKMHVIISEDFATNTLCIDYNKIGISWWIEVVHTAIILQYPSACSVVSCGWSQKPRFQQHRLCLVGVSASQWLECHRQSLCSLVCNLSNNKEKRIIYTQAFVATNILKRKGHCNFKFALNRKVSSYFAVLVTQILDFIHSA